MVHLPPFPGACSTAGYSSLWQSTLGAAPFNTTALLAASNTSYAATTLTSAWESPDFARLNHCTRSSAFFTAFEAGDHSFMVTADDVAQLNATWHNVGGA